MRAKARLDRAVRRKIHPYASAPSGKQRQPCYAPDLRLCTHPSALTHEPLRLHAYIRRLTVQPCGIDIEKRIAARVGLKLRHSLPARPIECGGYRLGHQLRTPSAHRLRRKAPYRLAGSGLQNEQQTYDGQKYKRRYDNRAPSSPRPSILAQLSLHAPTSHAVPYSEQAGNVPCAAFCWK